jgi:hypothetical protein
MPCAELSPTDQLSCDAGGPAIWGRSHGGGRGGACLRARPVTPEPSLDRVQSGNCFLDSLSVSTRPGEADLAICQSGDQVMPSITRGRGVLATNNAYLISFGGADDTIDKVEAEKKF